MHCQQANELFSDYTERVLDPAMTVSVDNHLAACPSCREEMAAFRRVWTHLDQAPMVEPPARLHAGIMDALDAHLQSEHQKVTPRAQAVGWSLRDLRDLFRPRTLAYAATALVLALSSLELVQSQRAALGPLGMVAHLLHLQPKAAVAVSLPTITATHSEWLASPSGGGTLAISMKVDPAKAAVLEPLTYRAEILADNPTQNEAIATSTQGSFDTAGVTTLRLPMPNGISGPTVRIALSFWSSNDARSAQKVAQQEIVVPVEQK